MNKSKPTLSVLALVMINVIAICSLRNVAIGATYGFSLLFYYALFALTFFIPSALISAELTTGWPQSGGVYVWVREAFGKPIAFVIIFIQWIYNICWYPTILSIMAATLAYVIDPKLASNTWYMLSVISITYWLITIITLRGMYISSMLSTVTAIVGTLIPVGFSTPLKEIGKFHCLAEFSDVNLIENELDHVLVGFNDIEKPSANPIEEQDSCRMELNFLKQDIRNYPSKYTVWLPQLIDVLLKNIDIYKLIWVS